MSEIDWKWEYENLCKFSSDFQNKNAVLEAQLAAKDREIEGLQIELAASNGAWNIWQAEAENLRRVIKALTPRKEVE